MQLSALVRSCIPSPSQPRPELGQQRIPGQRILAFLLRVTPGLYAREMTPLGDELEPPFALRRSGGALALSRRAPERDEGLVCRTPLKR